jgi:hypothetical protein
MAFLRSDSNLGFEAVKIEHPKYIEAKIQAVPSLFLQRQLNGWKLTYEERDRLIK